MLTGVHEGILDNLPTERTRYTALGAVMICTASVGGISMFFTLSEVLGYTEVWFILIAAFWAVFILCIDCWLVSSTAGSRWRTRVSVLLPRLAIAAVFGVVIAEPLVLRVFETGIVNHVVQERRQAIDGLRTSLVDCNPVPGVASSGSQPSVGCAGMILNISNPAAGTLVQINSLNSQKSYLQSQVNTETNQLNQLEATVNAECNGSSGTGLTGVFGNGPACKADEQYVTSYKASHPIAAQNTQIDVLGNKITALSATLSNQQAGYRQAIAQAVAKRVNQETPPNAPVGMAERFQALAYLSASNTFIGTASWFVRIFFILIDCLPVLVKFISGSTPYDRLVDDEVISAEKRFRASNETRNAVDGLNNGVTVKRAEAEAARKMNEINLDILQHDAERETMRDDVVDKLWHRKLWARRAGAETRATIMDLAHRSNGPVSNDATDQQNVNGTFRHVDDDIASPGSDDR